jgi:hypothetical protein
MFQIALIRLEAGNCLVLLAHCVDRCCSGNLTL